MHWTIQQVARALGAPPPEAADLQARPLGVSIDSRTIRRGELFFAIHGPRHDGHDFVAAALESGAVAAVVSRHRWTQYKEDVRGKLFAVDDPLVALQQLASALRHSWRCGQPGRWLAAVTGSAGKTTTKEVLAALLAARVRVLKSEGNLNNEYGVPLSLLRLEEQHGAAVLEFGMNHRGEIAKLTRIAEPEVGIVTCVAPVHLEFFSSVEEIALAKRELVENLTGPGATAVLNADDPRVAAFAPHCSGRPLFFGTTPGAQCRAENIRDLGLGGTEFDYVSPEWTARLRLSLPGRHNLMNTLAALAAASVWELEPGEAQKVLADLEPVSMRGQVLRFAAGFTLINDSYNSNPAALAANVDLLTAAGGFLRRILVAGEMLELGPTSAELHRSAGRHAARRGVDWIFGVQGQAQEIIHGAVAAGHPAQHTEFFCAPEEAAAFLARFVVPGDLLLVKGSRGVKMERIVESFLEWYPLAGAEEER